MNCFHEQTPAVLQRDATSVEAGRAKQLPELASSLQDPSAMQTSNVGAKRPNEVSRFVLQIFAVGYFC